MCGIIGQISFKKNASAAPSINSISHRGPDGSGEWRNSAENVYFGHTRLAILEPTPAGFQPMKNAGGRLVITFNGEIYNHLELRQTLPKIAWNGTSDTETLIELFSIKGLQALSLLKGMFAFACYDSADGSVTLVRDRLGIKPLWVKVNDDSLSFASEVRALMNFDHNFLTEEALSEYISYGRMPSLGKVIENIESLPPGSWLKVWAEGKIEKGTWWPDKRSFFTKTLKKDGLAKRVNELVTKAIEEHLISDVGVGSFLSGGIDSSIVTLVAGKVLGQQLKTFTVGFPQAAFDERLVAKHVADRASSSHFELEVTEDECLQSVMEAVVRLDLPSVDAINTYIVSKAVHNTGLKVALSGLGGDELFGGYPSFNDIPRIEWLQSFPKALSHGLIGLMSHNVQEKLGGIQDFSIQNLTISRRRFTSVANLKKMGLPLWHNGFLNEPGNLDTMSRISWAEIQGYMIPMLLRDSDQMSMAVGLEIRVPFLDHCLVEEILSIPQCYKKGQGVKPLLVEAFKNELPVEVYNRPKQGFALPMDEWMREPLSAFMKEGIGLAAELTKLNEPHLLMSRFLNSEIHWTRVWKWVTLGHWMNNNHISLQKQLTHQNAFY